MKPIYHILSLQPCANGYSAQVTFDPQHVVYSAHFPSNPITPGVILLQICKECVSLILKNSSEQTDFIISNIKVLKFTDFIVPQTDKVFNIFIQQLDNTFKTSVFDSDHQYAKMQFTISI